MTSAVEPGSQRASAAVSSGRSTGGNHLAQAGEMTGENDANEYDANLTETVHNLMPFARTLGLVVLRYDREEVRARLQWSPSCFK